MNLKIIDDKNKSPKTVLIGKTGILRLNKNKYSQLLGLGKTERWLCGIDLDEKIPKSIYVVKTNNTTSYLAKKMTLLSNSWSLDMNSVIAELKLKIPVKCTLESYQNDEMQGFKLKISIN